MNDFLISHPPQGHGGAPDMILRCVDPLPAGDYKLEMIGTEWWREEDGCEYFNEIYRVGERVDD